MKQIPVKWAREIGKRIEADGVIIIAVAHGQDSYAITSWGRTKAKCDALGKVIDPAQTWPPATGLLSAMVDAVGAKP